MSEVYNELVNYFDGVGFEEFLVTRHNFHGNKQEMYIVKRGLQYIHVHVNGPSDYTSNLHHLNINTGEKIRISADFRETSIKDILDPLLPSLQNPPEN